jgi:UDP-N-acetylmuramate dehydrogenase
MKKQLEELQQLLGGRGRFDEPLARYTTFKVGGPADLFFEARTKEDLLLSVGGARKLGIPVFLLGGGSNILIGDRGIRGLVVKNLTQQIVIRGMKGSSGPDKASRIVFVEADAGVPINKLVRFTLDEGLSGLEMHLGLPGSVGGAVYMNSKWTKPEGYIGDAVYQVTLVGADGTPRVEPQSYFRFAYDSSILQQTHDIVVSVVFALKQQDKTALWAIADASIGYRRETQPQGVFSAGCTFRNISHAEALAAGTPNYVTSAGFLVDHAGLKGEQIGDAQISPVHANFIINKGKATASDVVKLIDLAKDRVEERFGIKLTEEIQRVGEF